MPVIEILNPQDLIPEVKSEYTVLGGVETLVDLNEDSWATDYFVVFFHTGPSDPVSTSILRAVDNRNETQPCKVTLLPSGSVSLQVVGVSLDTSTALFSWLDSEPDLRDFNVPLMADRDAVISRAFGVLQKVFSSDQSKTGFPANAVFIVDDKDRVRHHTVLDSRVAFNVEEVARLVAAYRATDGGRGLAMADWREEGDTVANTIPAIQSYYSSPPGPEAAGPTTSWRSTISSLLSRLPAVTTGSGGSKAASTKAPRSKASDSTAAKSKEAGTNDAVIGSQASRKSRPR